MKHRQKCIYTLYVIDITISWSLSKMDSVALVVRLQVCIEIFRCIMAYWQKNSRHILVGWNISNIMKFYINHWVYFNVFYIAYGVCNIYNSFAGMHKIKRFQLRYAILNLSNFQYIEKCIDHTHSCMKQLSLVTGNGEKL